MIGIFDGCKANNNEEYRKVLKTRMNLFIVMFVIGLITLIVAILAKTVWTVKVNDHMLGVYTGLGSGLIAGAAVLWVKSLLTLKDEQKLKKSRLNDTDERLQEISRKALRAATIALLIALYGVGLIGGLYYPIMVKVLLLMVNVFLFGYLIAYKVYERRCNPINYLYFPKGYDTIEALKTEELGGIK